MYLTLPSFTSLWYKSNGLSVEIYQTYKTNELLKHKLIFCDFYFNKILDDKEIICYVALH